ncbi:PAS domain S-box protein [Roseibacterium sp. SDUM158017]|uniref:PAS domain S-box protein n=1 Tax=Roseicyclus salinarum TaxID=3036773 RepID=UPI0024154642|nr:PAS domain S-box protein [Roseibacterium sp. SDUM158017]MDG4650211.1 PAS domain S-box protein [Roseibacterium sp. SDUM158017]
MPPHYGAGTYGLNMMMGGASRELLDEIERASGMGTWAADLGTGALEWSARARAIHEASRDVVPCMASALAFYPAPGRGALAEAVQALHDDGRPLDLTLPFVTATGRARWVRITGVSACVASAPHRVHGTIRDVTDERADKRQLRRLAALAENTTNAVIVTDADGLVEWVNTPCERLTGYSLEDLRGRKPGDMLQCEDTDPATVALIAARLARAEPVDVEILNRDRQGQDYWVQMEIMPLRDPDGSLAGFVAIETEITERKCAESALARAARLGRMIDASLNEVFVFDAGTLRFVEVNLGARRNLGYSTEELTAMTPLDIKPDMTRADFEGVIGPLLGGERDTMTFRTSHRRRDGTTYPAEIRLQLMGGDRPVFVAMVQDTTDRDAAEAAVVEARERAEEANRAKTAFLATMSHEIRTPMNGVLGMAELLDASLTDPAQRRMLAVIRESGELLVQIINDILDLSKVEAGRMTFEEKPFDPADLARRVEGIYTFKASERRISFSARVAGEACGPRIGDAHRILQILHNLIGNAIKFTEHGEVFVVIDGAPGRPLRFVVSDTGIGMTSEQVAQAFEAFAQADSSTTRKYGGTGLGMSIVRSLVAGMGGEIGIESAPGRGTRVTVTLPLPMAARMPDRERAPTEAAGRPPLDVSVLAADDNAVNRMVLGAMLARLGARVTMVDDGPDAVAAWEPDAFDALLLDVSMPGMDGIEALAAIREREARAGAPPAPAVAITAHVLDHQVREILGGGFAAHLAKPLDLASLEAVLRGLSAAPRGATLPGRGPSAVTPRG